MSKLNSFEDIIAWQKARELNAIIYSITNLNNSFSKRLWIARLNEKSKCLYFFKYC